MTFLRSSASKPLLAARELLSGGEPDLHVLMLTTFDLDEYVYEALRAGASGFLLKDATTAERVHAIPLSPRATRCSHSQSPGG